MSSLVIAGNTSGSITLSAPATAGSNTITLPAETGTLVTTATSTGISGSAITTGTVGVSVGGTGANTLTANNVILGNGTSAVQFVAPGSSGNVLTSNGTTWTSQAATGGQLQTEMFSSPGTWTKPASCSQVRVTVVGGGGGSNPGGFSGGGGGVAIAMVPVSAPVSITVGSGGAASSSGNTSSFGPAVSATGGGAGSPTSVPGTGTVSVGTALKTSVGISKNSSANTDLSINSLFGKTSPPVAGGAYSTTSPGMAGSISTGPAQAGNGGAILIEFVG